MEKLLYSKGNNYQSGVYIQNERKKEIFANYTSDSGLTSRIKHCKN